MLDPPKGDLASISPHSRRHLAKQSHIGESSPPERSISVAVGSVPSINARNSVNAIENHASGQGCGFQLVIERCQG